MDAARELGADVSEKRFDEALRKVASAPPAQVHKAEAKKRKRTARKPRA